MCVIVYVVEVRFVKAILLCDNERSLEVYSFNFPLDAGGIWLV